LLNQSNKQICQAFQEELIEQGMTQGGATGMAKILSNVVQNVEADISSLSREDWIQILLCHSSERIQRTGSVDKAAIRNWIVPIKRLATLLLEDKDDLLTLNSTDISALLPPGTVTDNQAVSNRSRARTQVKAVDPVAIHSESKHAQLARAILKERTYDPGLKLQLIGLIHGVEV
jgi:hypothetical protein